LARVARDRLLRGGVGGSCWEGGIATLTWWHSSSSKVESTAITSESVDSAGVVGAGKAAAANVAFVVGVGEEEMEGDCSSTSITTGAILAATVIGTLADTASVAGMVEPGVDPCIWCWDGITPPGGEEEVIEGGGKRAFMMAEG